MVVRVAAFAALLLCAGAGCGGGGGIAAPAALVPPGGHGSSATPSPAPTAGTFDVRSYGARCDGTTDDAAAIQRTEQFAAAAATVQHGTVVSLPAGTCAIGAPIAWDSNVSLTGAGMHATTLTALAGFTYDPAKVRVGADGRQIGMIWLDGPSATAPIQNVTIENLGFDPRAGQQNWNTTTGVRTYQCINAEVRPVQFLTVQHVYFELGANATAAYTSSGNEGPKAFVGVQLSELGVDPLNPSHDVTLNDIHTHNGEGTLRFALLGSTKNGVTSSFYDLTITNEYDTIDLDNIEDDRIEIDGLTAPYGKPLVGAPLGTIRHLTFRNINVQVAPTVTVGSVNALRLNSGYNTEISDATIDGVTYVGSPSGYLPLAANGLMHDGTGSAMSMNGNDIQGYVNDLVVQNVVAQNTIGVGITVGAPPGEPLAADVRNIVVHDAFIYGGMNVTFMTPTPTVRRANAYDVTIENVTVDGAPSNALNPAATPVGVEFARHLSTGGDEHVLLQNVSVTGNFATPLLIEPGFDGMQIDGVHWSGTAVIQSTVTETNSGPL